MPGFITVLEAANLADGQVIGVEIADTEVLIARVGDGFYAISNRCPHAGGKLSAGKLERFVITCPLHGSQFDIRNGDVIRWTSSPGWISWIVKIFKPPKSLPMYETKSEGGRVMVAIH